MEEGKNINPINPMMIIHKQGKPPGTEIAPILDRVKNNVGLRPNEYNLLKYYAYQQNKFHPAKKTISKATGIDPGNIKRYRQSLKHLSIIEISEYKRIIWINWPVIWGYALLDRPLNPGPKRSYFHQVRPDTIDYLELITDWVNEPYHYMQIGNIDECMKEKEQNE